MGVVKNGRYPEIQKWYEVQICSSWSKIPYPVVRLLLTKNANGITLHTGLIIDSISSVSLTDSHVLKLGTIECLDFVIVSNFEAQSFLIV